MSVNPKFSYFRKLFKDNVKKKPNRRLVLDVVELEARVTPSVSTPTFVLYHPAGGLQPFYGSANPSGTTPQEMRTAYGVNLAAFGSVAGDGTGQTIAIIDAYNQPDIASDVAAFDSYYHLPALTSFTQVNQTGGTSLPSADSVGGWGVETSLDVEWAHVIAPKASILLVEANSSYDSDLFTAVNTAHNWSGVSVVSMSWGGGETSGVDSTYNPDLTTPAFHNGVTFLASTGDGGAGIEFPAVSPNVVGVGGSSLYFGTGGTYSSESGWGGSGGGISSLTSQPGYQSGVVTQSSTQRTIPDVAMDADPGTGVPIYDTYDESPSTPWAQYGGTSLAAPMWAGVIAIANQGRGLEYGLGSLDGPSGTLPKLYSLPSSDFHDVTTGSNGYSAGVGYDLVTGRGTPLVNLVVANLASSWIVTDPNGNIGSGSAGDITLPFAVAHAQNGDAITFANSLKGDTITLNGTLTINYSFTITGLGAGELAVSGANAHQVFSIPAGVSTTISGLTIEQGEGSAFGTFGGGISNAGSLTLNNDAVSNNGFGNNEFTKYGAGIYNTGSMSVYGSTINGNTAWTDGGGIYNSGSMYLSNDTIANNAAYTGGGGIYNAGGTLTLYECTVSGNHGWNNSSTLPHYGGGIYVAGGTVYMDTTIVAGNEAYDDGSDIYGTVYDAYYCLIGNTGGLTMTYSGDNQLNVGANLGTLANNGGTTLTMAPLPGSAAHGNGDSFWAGGTSQNGAIRPSDPDIGCQGTSWVVTDPNGNAGSGSTGDVTLPYAVANAQNTDRITFASTLNGDTITLNATLTLSHNYSITGLGAANLAVSGNNLVQDFFVNPGVTASISGLTIKNGHESNGGGGGILNTGTLTINGCLISGNNGTVGGAYGYGSGGGILNTGSLTMSDSTLSGNVASWGGGLSDYNGGTASIDDCTFVGNSGGSGAGVNNFDGGALTLSNSTVAFNYGYGTYVSVMDNCIVAGNTSGNIYAGDSGNFTSTSTTGLATTLAYNGATTPTLALLPGSAAHAAGNPYYAGTISQNGATRPAVPDAGAYQGTLWIVTDPNGALGSGSAGDVTLPYAVANAQNSDQITFAKSLAGDTITLNATLTIAHSYTITGLGAANLAVSGNGSVQDFYVDAGVSAGISDLTIKNGSAGFGGGVENFGTLTLNADDFTGNYAGGSGGGVYNGGTLTLTDSTFDGNYGYFGGGLDNTGGVAIATIDDCTFFGNSSTGSGSGVNNWAGDVINLSNSTIAYNSGGSGGVYNTGGEVSMDNCIAAGNSTADTYLTTGAFNLTGVTANMATALAYNGGSTKTLALLPGSAAHAAGDPGQAGTTSQNGEIRPAAPDIGAVQGTSWIVTDPNGAVGSGSAGDVTLPYAVANAQDTDHITFASGLSGDTITLNGVLTIAHSYSITGLGAANLAVSGGNSVQDFVVNTGVTTSISALTIENGIAGDGSGIENLGALTLANDAISSNGTIANGTNVYGGGIFNSGTLNVSDSTIDGNASYYDGGGLFNTGSASLVNSTISFNAAYTYGGGIYTSGTLALTDCTVAGNYGWDNYSGYPEVGGGIEIGAGTTTMDNTIVAANVTTGTGPDISGTIATANYCLIGNTSGNTITSGANNQLNVSANLAGLAYNGGPTQTQALLPGSAAHATGDPGQAGTTSQNGVLRYTSPDIGAFQTQPPTVTANAANLPDTSTTLTINGSNFDTNAANDTVAFNLGLTGTVAAATATQLTVTINTPPTSLGNLTAVVSTFGAPSGAPVQVATEVNSNWHVTDASGTLGGGSLSDMTLPYAVSHALNGDTIDFAGALSGSTINLTGTLTIGHSYSITGLGATNLAVSGNNTSFGVFSVNAGVTASISGLTIEHGQTAYGGGINNAGALTLTGDAISDNGTLSNSGTFEGAGIYNSGTLTMTDCTVNGNNNYWYGGGIFNATTGNATLANCTITGNTAFTTGGGISDMGTMSLTNCTVSDNSGWGGFTNYPEYGGGISTEGEQNNLGNNGTLTMDNTIVASNSTTGTGPDIFGTVASANYCLIGTTGGFTITTGSNDLLGVSANLAGLANNGGPTQTQALLTGSHALGAGDPAQAGATSQNGVLRPAVPDIGAYQTPAAGGAPTVVSVVVNGGSPVYTDSNGHHVSLAGQNSIVEQIEVTFSEAVNLAAGAFTIVNNHAGVTVISGAGPSTLAVNASWSAVSGSGNTQWIVTFSGPGTTALAYGGSGTVIDNGLYSLHITAADVTAQVGGTAMASNSNTGFWAMYGAVYDNSLSGTIGDGSSEVFLDANDETGFASLFNNGYDSSMSQYAPLVGFDYDLAGFADANTFNAFATTFNSGQDWIF